MALVTYGVCCLTVGSVWSGTPESQHPGGAHDPRGRAPAATAPPPPPPSPTLPPPRPGAAAFLPPPPYLPPAPLVDGPHQAPDKRRGLAIVIGIAAVLGLVCTAGLLLVGGGGPSEPKHPEVWDQRVTELVAFVERERGLTFEHPVYVDFLPAEDIARAMRGEQENPSGEQMQAAATQASQLRALGLISGDVDLLASSEELTAEGVVAFYDPVSERIVAPDEELGPRQRATLVHELTHALQDQHFDLDDTQANTMAPGTFRALAEGDAVRIEQKYAAQLSAAEQAALTTDEEQDYAAFEEATAEISPTLAALQLAPYILGEGMVNTVFDLDGQAGIDNSFLHPPISEEALFDPSHYRGNGTVVPVAAPNVVAGEEVLDEGELGPLTWYLMLAEVIDPGSALKASFGWGGDTYVMVRNNDQNCMRISYKGDTAADLGEMQNALDGWIAAAPGIRREVSVVGDQLLVVGCDPGTDVTVPLLGTSEDALFAPRMVMETAVELHRSQNLPYQKARCIATEFVGQYPLADLVAFVTAPTASPEQLATRDAYLAAAVGLCG